MSRVVRERSAGAVVFSTTTGAREYLLLRYGAGYWGFPKGHVEAGETDEQAAAREVAEETAIPPTAQRFVPGFQELTAYHFQRGKTRVQKDVLFYLVEALTKDVQISFEHTGFAWVPYEEAKRLVSFDGPQRVLLHAEGFLAARDAPKG